MAHLDTIDATTFILEQHQMIRDLFDVVADAAPEARREAFEPLVRLLAVHETAEELVVYPVVERSGSEGKAVAQARKVEEDAAKKDLADLEKLDPSKPGFLARLERLRTDVEAHAKAEERDVLPLLGRIGDERLRHAMARGLVVAEAMAPTHPHKSAPESMVGNLLVGPVVGMIDRIRDAIRDATR